MGSSPAIIEKRGTTFVRNDGTMISGDAITTLLETTTHPLPWFSVERSGYDRAGLAASLESAEAYLGDAREMPSVRAAFESLYFDEDALSSWFRSGWIKPLETISDYSPEIDVVIQTSSGRVEIYSGSQNHFMLPLYITDKAGWHDDWDPGLSRAVAALMGKSMIRGILRSDAVPKQWGGDIASSPVVEAAVLRDGITAGNANALAAARGLAIAFEKKDTTASLDSLKLWEGSIYELVAPQIHYLFSLWRSTPERFAQHLNGVHDILERLRAHEWLMTALAHNPQIRIEIAPWQQGYTTWTRTFKRVRLTDAAMTLEREGPTVTFFDVNEKHGRSHWAILKNGNLMLVEFSGDPIFPYGPGWYANVHRVYDSYFQTNVSGVMVSPDGTIEE